MQQNGIHEVVKELKTRVERHALHPWLENTENLDGKLRFVAAQTFDEFGKELDKDKISLAIGEVSKVISEYTSLVEEVKQERRYYRRMSNKIALLTGLGAGALFLSGLSIDSYFRYGHLPWLDVKSLDILLIYIMGIAVLTAASVKVYYQDKGGALKHFIHDVPKGVRNNYLETRDNLFRRIENAYHRSTSG